MSGAVDVSGAKNAVVAILPAVILSDSPCLIENIPNIADVSTSLSILESLGAQVNRLDRNTVEIDPRTIHTCEVDYELARHMRASYYFIGALLGKYLLYPTHFIRIVEEIFVDNVIHIGVVGSNGPKYGSGGAASPLSSRKNILCIHPTAIGCPMGNTIVKGL